MDQLIRQVTAHQWTPETRCRSQKSKGSGEVEMLPSFWSLPGPPASYKWMSIRESWTPRSTKNETELYALYTKIQKLKEEIAILNHKKLISKKLETAEMSLTGVLEVIFEVI